MKFRKKPVMVEAVPVRYILELETECLLPAWVLEALEPDPETDEGYGAKAPLERAETGDGVLVNTLEGAMFGNAEDWLICGVQGELYPCKRDIFEATYEPEESR